MFHLSVKGTISLFVNMKIWYANPAANRGQRTVQIVLFSGCGEGVELLAESFLVGGVYLHVDSTRPRWPHLWHQDMYFIPSFFRLWRRMILMYVFFILLH